MSESTSEATETQPTETEATETQGKPAEEALGDAGKQALDRMKAERNEANKRAKALEQELEKVRKASMSEAEKAVAEAEARGRSAATADFGKRLATSEIRAAAATAGADLDGVFDYLDLGRFVGEDGEPDTKAIEAFVGGLPKKGPAPAASLDLGVRPESKPDPGPGLARLRSAYATPTK